MTSLIYLVARMNKILSIVVLFGLLVACSKTSEETQTAGSQQQALATASEEEVLDNPPEWDEVLGEKRFAVWDNNDDKLQQHKTMSTEAKSLLKLLSQKEIEGKRLMSNPRADGLAIRHFNESMLKLETEAKALYGLTWENDPAGLYKCTSAVIMLKSWMDEINSSTRRKVNNSYTAPSQYDPEIASKKSYLESRQECEDQINTPPERTVDILMHKYDYDKQPDLIVSCDDEPFFGLGKSIVRLSCPAVFQSEINKLELNGKNIKP